MLIFPWLLLLLLVLSLHFTHGVYYTRSVVLEHTANFLSSLLFTNPNSFHPLETCYLNKKPSLNWTNPSWLDRFWDICRIQDAELLHEQKPSAITSAQFFCVSDQIGPLCTSFHVRVTKILRWTKTSNRNCYAYCEKVCDLLRIW